MLLNLIKDQRTDVSKIYFYVKDAFELKYELLNNRRKNVGIKQTKNPMTFMKNQKGSNPTKKIKMVIVSDDMIADMEANKILKAIASE